MVLLLHAVRALRALPALNASSADLQPALGPGPHVSLRATSPCSSKASTGPGSSSPKPHPAQPPTLSNQVHPWAHIAAQPQSIPREVPRDGARAAMLSPGCPDPGGAVEWALAAKPCPDQPHREPPWSPAPKELPCFCCSLRCVRMVN